mmetsp:Transcript_33283/g.105254  ORF Transcript_33283/g.105254 Transcript_33283/m.105254 type:complete len:277 (-) Transcript_33283:2691-3521(-)
MMTRRAASMPRVSRTSQMLLLSVSRPSTPGVPITVPRPLPSTRSVYFLRPPSPSSWLMTARPMLGMPCTMTDVSAAFRSCNTKYMARLGGMPSVAAFFPVVLPGQPSGGRTRRRSRRPMCTSTWLLCSARRICGRLLRVPKGSLRMHSFTVSQSMLRCSAAMAFMSRCTLMYTSAGVSTSCILSATSPSVVFSSRALTTRALISLSSCNRRAVMMGVEILELALMISLSRGTPSVTFIDATPAKWNVLSVICVPGSDMDCAPMAPTASPGSTMLRA